MSAPAVLVDDLVVRFGALTAVGGVSFAVSPGLRREIGVADRLRWPGAEGLLITDRANDHPYLRMRCPPAHAFDRSSLVAEWSRAIHADGISRCASLQCWLAR